MTVHLEPIRRTDWRIECEICGAEVQVVGSSYDDARWRLVHQAHWQWLDRGLKCPKCQEEDDSGTLEG